MKFLTTHSIQYKLIPQAPNLTDSYVKIKSEKLKYVSYELLTSDFKIEATREGVTITGSTPKVTKLEDITKLNYYISAAFNECERLKNEIR